MKGTVFYSWQSTLPNSTNRAVIQEALEEAVKALRADDEIEVDLVVDRDTSGVPGSPDIALTIFDKIDRAAVFVGDVSNVTPSDFPSNRASPNPNVMIELGYAFKTIGTARTVMVMNTAFGGPELLPFNLKLKRALKYHLPADGSVAKPAVRKMLARQLEEALRSVLDEIKSAHAQQQSVPTTSCPIGYRCHRIPAPGTGSA